MASTTPAQSERSPKSNRLLYGLLALLFGAPCLLWIAFVAITPYWERAEDAKYPIGAKLTDLHISDGQEFYFHNEDPLSMPTLKEFMKGRSYRTFKDSLRLVGVAPNLPAIKYTAFGNTTYESVSPKGKRRPERGLHDLENDPPYVFYVDMVNDNKTVVFDTPERIDKFTGVVQI